MVVNSLVKAITGPKRELAKVGATVTTSRTGARGARADYRGGCGEG